MNSLALSKDRPADLPATYEAARAALARCEALDECKDWANKAAALASYARQSRDDSLVVMAQKIQARAIRRCGELLREVPQAKGVKSGPTRTAHAREAGISAYQQAVALRLVSIPQEKFDALIESNSPPSVSKLTEYGKKPGTPHTNLNCCPSCGRPF